MEDIILFKLGPTHTRLVESAFALARRLDGEDIPTLPEPERDAVVLQCLAHEVTKNGFVNFADNGYARILPDLLPALFRIGTETSLRAARLITTCAALYIEQARIPKPHDARTDAHAERCRSRAEDAADDVDRLIHKLLSDAEDYFARREAERSSKLCRHDEPLRVEFDPVAFTRREDLATIDETEREDAGEYDYTERQARGLLIRKHHPELKGWGTCALNWARDDYESHYLLISGGLGNEDCDRRDPEFLAYLWLRLKGKTDWHGMDDEVRETVRELWGSDVNCCA